MKGVGLEKNYSHFVAIATKTFFFCDIISISKEKNERGKNQMKIIKRDGTIVDYNPEKIRVAIQKANNEVSRKEKISKDQIQEIIKYIEELQKPRILVEDIQDIIEEKLMEIGKYQLAKKYITYRYTRELVRNCY